MMVDHNKDVTKRMNWFDRQFLRAQDFADEQDYSLDRRHRHNRLLHTSGVGEGLTVTGEVEDTDVTVATGTAYDDAGRELVLTKPIVEQLPASLATATKAEVYLVYEEQAVDPSADPGVTGEPNRVREAARVTFRETDPNVATPPTSPTPSPDGPVAGVPLAELSLKDGKLAGAPTNSVRHHAGALLTEAALAELILSVDNKPQAEWPRLFGKASKTIGVAGDLALGDGSLLLGPEATPARVHFDPATKILSLGGPAGVVAQTDDGSQDALYVEGNMRVGPDTNQLKFSSSWSGFPDGVTTNSEISNDVSAYKTLMIVGNRSAGGVRRVGVWDHLDVNGSAAVTGVLAASTGNDNQHGIQFSAGATAADPGDEAFIRYTGPGAGAALTIGIRDDADDHISFVQGNQERLRLSQGMAHMGAVDGHVVNAGEVVGAVGFWGPGIQHGQMAFRAGSGFEFVDMSVDGPRLAYARDSHAYADITTRQIHIHESPNVAAQLDSPGRLHITGGEILFLLNKNGVIIGKEWAGSGSLRVEGTTELDDTVQANSWMKINGNLGVAGKDPNGGWPTNWGGIHTQDVHADGSILTTDLNTTGNKRFVIDHPLDPENKSLIHACLEGPENGIYYRGEGRLDEGTATVDLPDYFEAVAREEGRTVHLTPIFEDDEPVSALAASRVRSGSFTVRTVDGAPASHAFSWEVRAIRSDIDPLKTEELKDPGVHLRSSRAHDDLAVAGAPV
jgi:hypothetical protein